MSPLHVPQFDGGVVLAGSADSQRTNELQLAESYEIGPRGQLVVASDLSDYLTLQDLQAPRAAWSKVHGFGHATFGNVPYVIAVGEGRDVNGFLRYLAAYLHRTSETNPQPTAQTFTYPTTGVATKGVYITIEQFPGLTQTLPNVAKSIALINIGAREGNYANIPSDFPAGLYFLIYDPSNATFDFQPSTYYNVLGIGTAAGGTHSVQAYFRGIIGYNNHAFGWGFDHNDATHADGPNRLMFSNIGTPIQWGNDNISTAADRAFTDSDAILLGDAGEIIRGALRWDGRLFFGTNRGLHFIGGFGRDSFLTDGARPITNAYNIVGPNALIEGPDKLLYGVSDQGLWAFDGQTFEPHFKRLVDFRAQSNGWWDLIWTDPTQVADYPGQSNQDLVWTALDPDREQLLIGIPWCSAANGYGYGTDTVVIKFHLRGGGFTRQVFTGVQYTAAAYFAREGQQPATKWWGTATNGIANVRRYAYQATPASAPILPSVLPKVKFGPYAPFGPDGQGVIRRGYLTLAWADATALPLVFTVTSTVDQNQIDSYTLTIGPTAPVAPAAGDCWLDTSQSNTSLGNQTAGTNIVARGGYLYYTWSGSVWRLIPGQGAKGTRATLPLPLTRVQGIRWTLELDCTSAAGRYQVEGLGVNPGDGSTEA